MALTPPPIHARPDPPSRLCEMDGVLLVDKPSGMTSHDVVDAVRRKFRIGKVGHGGTLDPQATGLLVLLLGRGTKLSETFMGSDKMYEGVMRLGVETDTQDADGKTLREADCAAIDRVRLEQAMAQWTGDVWQVPPMVSAKKVNGVPLYKLARRGQTIERKPKLVHVYEFSVRDFQLPNVSFVVRCTRGVYVRTLCADVGDILGCGAHLAALRRTKSGALEIGQAVPLARVLALSSDELRPLVLPIRQFAAVRR
jgi:tRNA pseudouridine55 synthase